MQHSIRILQITQSLNTLKSTNCQKNTTRIWRVNLDQDWSVRKVQCQDVVYNSFINILMYSGLSIFRAGDLLQGGRDVLPNFLDYFKLGHIPSACRSLLIDGFFEVVCTFFSGLSINIPFTAGSF